MPNNHKIKKNRGGKWRGLFYEIEKTKPYAKPATSSTLTVDNIIEVLQEMYRAIPEHDYKDNG